MTYGPAGTSGNALQYWWVSLCLVFHLSNLLTIFVIFLKLVLLIHISTVHTNVKTGANTRNSCCSGYGSGERKEGSVTSQENFRHTKDVTTFLETPCPTKPPVILPNCNATHHLLLPCGPLDVSVEQGQGVREVPGLLQAN